MGKIHDALQKAERLRTTADRPDERTAAVDVEMPAPRESASSKAPRAPGFFARRRAARATPRERGSLLIPTSDSLISEEYRTLRARIQSLRRSRELRSIVITSTRAGEGKTTTAANLALAFGLERETSTCLVDADLRTGRVHELFGGKTPVGLAELLEGDAKLDEALVAVPDTRLRVLPVRALPTAPSELLGSRAMADLIAELHTRFHTVIVDAPPVIGLPDALTLVDACDATLFVVGAGRAPRDEVESALERLDAAKLLGVVLNRCEQHEVPYAGGYGYGRN